MNEPDLVPRNSLTGTRVCLSVSESADLARLGLTERHCRLVIAELTQALLLAGATVVYGGRLVPEGYTQILLDQVQRFQEENASLEIVLAETEFQKLDFAALDEAEQRMSTFGRLRFVLADGTEVPLSALPRTPRHVDPAEALSAMRSVIAATTSARVLVGGRLTGYQGSEPGLIEEARLSAEHGAILYPIAGYGGAAAAVAFTLASRVPEWVPPRFPAHADQPNVQKALSALRCANAPGKRPWNGLDDADAATLTRTHRPADIAALVVRGLARVKHADPPETTTTH